MDSLRRLSLYYHTVRHLHREQVQGRLALWGRHKLLYRLPGYVQRHFVDPVGNIELRQAWQAETLLAHLPLAPLDDATSMLTTAENILEGKFAFLSECRQWSDFPEWQPAEQRQLWVYNLHYFEYAVALGVAYRRTGQERFYSRWRALATDWMDHYPGPAPLAWDPYPTALRIVNWLLSYHLFVPGLELDEDQSQVFTLHFQDSLYRQARYLSQNLEYHLLGNHLWEDARALMFAGLFFAGPEADTWLHTGEAVLWAEVQEQVLPDGGHYERSPMYHSIMLHSLVTAVLALKAANRSVPACLLQRIADMAHWIQSMIHPDGQIALFNDCGLDVSPDLDKLRREVIAAGGNWSAADQPPELITLPDSGYYVINGPGKGCRLLLDCGDLGPSYQPGHAHCDTLSYELSVGGLRFVVDSGTYDYYGLPDWRAYNRSTRAHNAVVVDGQEQSEMWGDFRVGRRARAYVRQATRADGAILFTGEHDGYRRLAGGVIHRRHVIFLPCGVWIIWDELLGKGGHNMESWLHWHDQVTLVKVGPTCWQATRRGQHLWLWSIGETEHSLHFGEERPLQGWYCERFGTAVPALAWRAHWQGDLPQQHFYLLSLHSPVQWQIDYQPNAHRLTLAGSSIGKWQISLVEGVVQVCSE